MHAFTVVHDYYCGDDDDDDVKNALFKMHCKTTLHSAGNNNKRTIQGKGGEAIESLQNTMGVSMSMSTDKNSVHRELSVSGLPGNVAATLQMVAEKVRNVVPGYELPDVANNLEAPRARSRGSSGDVMYWAGDYLPPLAFSMPPPMPAFPGAMYPTSTIGMDVTAAYGWHARAPPVMMAPPSGPGGWMPPPPPPPFGVPPPGAAGMFMPHMQYYDLRPASEDGVPFTAPYSPNSSAS